MQYFNVSNSIELMEFFSEVEEIQGENAIKHIQSVINDTLCRIELNFDNSIYERLKLTRNIAKAKGLYDLFNWEY